jgi:hypothetical protein
MHRDPDTGQFLSHDDTPVDLNYSDHEFLNFYLSFQAGGSADTLGTEFKIEDDVLDLENDELGMLTWISTAVTVGFSRFSEPDETRGGAVVSVETGANLADSEFLGLASTNSGVQITDEEAAVNYGALQASDEAGLWTSMTAGSQSPFKQEDSDGDDYSGGGDFNNDRQTRHFYDETGEGPYIDSTDDVTVGVLVEKDQVNATMQIQIVGQMSFLVFEYENRRAEFAPYDPGP